MAPVPSETEVETAAANTAAEPLLAVLTPVAPDLLGATLGNLSAAFAGRLPGRAIAVAVANGTPQAEGFAQTYPNLRLLAGDAAAVSAGAWVPTAADYLNLYKAAQQSGASACLLLGPEAHSLSGDALRGLAAAVGDGADLAVPRYELGPREGLVNSALLYPVSRAIFGSPARFPLAADLGMSPRMAARMAAAAQKFTAANHNDALMWPVAEAAVAGYRIVEVPAGTRTLPQPASASGNTDLNALLAQIGSSFFSEIELHAAFWQRTRVAPQPARADARAPLGADTFPDVGPMLEAFLLAYTNLHEIWSLVLPPNSLLSLKRLSHMPAASFRMGDALWARIVYDFILAYRLRTLNRGHLLGALTPLYLAWVASHILLARAGGDPERHIEECALAFETDKPYLLSRWRWPDRFNP